ncbi:MAG TPA: PAS domain-containing sensor histidine kinase [Cyclobacteriaceae bacterium]|nr:PAS domain-containing sensor histidine kinase [Cyclobacteriaceae bacterium]
MEKKDTIKSRINTTSTKAMGISPQKLPEDISENEQRYRELVEHLPLGIAILLDGKLMFLNLSGALMMAGEKPEDLIGRNFLDFVHPDYQEIVSNRILRVQHGEVAPASEQKYIRLDGKVIDVEVSSYPFVYHNKPAVQIIVKDITEQKESRLAVKKTETLFSQLFHVSPMAIAMLDNEGRVAQVNPGFEKMFGYTFEELKGQELNQTIVPDSLESEGNDLNTLISTQQVVRIETKRKRKDGAMLSVIIYGLPVHFEDKTIGIFGVYVDITEQKKVEEELKVRNTELDNFVYKVSHDLRAPLSSVLGLINLARLPGNDDNLKDYFGVIEKKVNQLDHFITDVLSHSKNLKLDVIIEAIDFHELIDQTFIDLSYLKGAEQIKRSIIVNGAVFYSDRWRIAEIFRNLVSNAIKYRDFNKSNPEINVAIVIDENQAIITFKDNGIGIELHNLEKIFNMFYRASEQSDGSGLGLYIVKNATDKLRGEVQVSSTIGEGTSFVINLPNRAPVLTEE